MNVYRHEDSDSTSLGDDESTCVLEYDKKRILVGTNTGIQVFNYDTNKFTKVPIQLFYSDNELSARVIRAIRLSDNRIYLCLAGYGCGEVKEDKQGRLFVKQITDYNTDGNSPIQFFEDKQNRIWFINSRRQVYREVNKGKYKQYPIFADATGICMSSSGKMYVVTINNGLYLYDTKTDSFTQVATGSECGLVYSMNEWTFGRLFICTDGGGLRIYDENTHTLTQSSIQVGDFNLATSNVKDAICDSFGNVWVGIYLKGIMMKPVSKSRFEYIGRHSITKNTIGTNSIVSICPDTDGRMWVGTDNSGLYLLSADGTSSVHFDPDEHPGMPKTFTEIARTNSGTLLLGSYLEGLYKYQNGTISLLNGNIKYIFDIQPAENGYYWIASMGQGVIYFNPETGDTQNPLESWNNTAPENNRFGNFYSSCIRAIKNHIYIGSYNGLNICEVKQGKILSNKKFLEHVNITHMAELDGYLWVTTNKGLYSLDIKTNKIEHYTTADGLSINSLKSIVADNGKLWIGSDNGLICFNTKTHECDIFFDADGLQDNEFCTRAAIKANGRLYFGGISGLTYFDDQTIQNAKKNSHSMNLKLVDLQVSNKIIHVGDMSGSYEILSCNIDDGGEIHLSHRDNHISIQLCVDGVLNQHITYEYSINGKDWTTEAQSVNRLVFDNLEPGTYKIHIRAKGYEMTSDERIVTVIVHAPWYASTLAKIFYFLILSLLLWLTYQYAQRQVAARKLIARHRQEKELNEARIQFFMNISHEIRTPMTLILAPLEKLISSDKDESRQRNYQLMRQNSNRILRLINQMMDVRKIEQGKFQLEYKRVELVSLLQNMFDVFTTNAQNRNITYEFKHDMQSLAAFVDPENVDKIVMNLLSNAFKFTPDKGKITLSLSEKPNSTFNITVCDTGCGITDQDKKKVFDRFYSASHKNGYIGTGIGLNLASMLVNLHKGTINVEDNPSGIGTQFTVDIPIGNKSLVSRISLPNAEEMETVSSVEHTDAESLAAPALELDKATDIRNKRIILVEDDEAIRQYVHTELSSEFHIHECTNGQEAWDYIIAHPNKVNLIISDIMMPVMDGMTLCQKVKANFTTNHIPIILMTALGSDADRIAGITNGADGYVSKPFNIDVLRSTAINLLKTRMLLQGKFNGEKQQEEHIEKVEVESPDEHLMRRVMKCINENMDNPDLSVEMIADKVGISRVHFYRKMKDLTGQSPRDYLKYVRLKEAARLIKEKKNMDITGVSIAVGFKTLSGFSNNFKALYGKSPSEYAKEAQSDDNV